MPLKVQLLQKYYQVANLSQVVGLHLKGVRKSGGTNNNKIIKPLCSEYFSA